MGDNIALILGGRGQDGQLLSRYLDQKGYRVVGVDVDTRDVILTDATSVTKLIEKIKPAEIYHFAAIHHSSEEKVEEDAAQIRKTFEVNLFSLYFVLDAMRVHVPKARLLFASSSHIFGIPQSPIQDESTPFNSDSVYGITKTAGLLACRSYRQKYGIFASTAILYTHESPLRSEKFLSKRIVLTALEIKRALDEGREPPVLLLGKLDAVIDWGWAPDFVRAMHLILQNKNADEFVVATGYRHTVRDFVEAVFESLDLDWQHHVKEQTQRLIRPSVERVGCPDKLKTATGWAPSMTFRQMAQELVRDAENSARTDA